jgi:fatty-acyl-CoA synthase
LSEVDRFGKALVERIGIRRGDVVAMWSANLYEFIVVQLALARIGAVYCSVSPLYKTAELEHLLTSAKVKALVYPGPESLQNFAIDYNGVLEAANKPYLKDLIYLESDDGPGTGNSGLRSHSLRYLINSNDGVIDQAILDDVEPDDIANIFFTSGTTGKPKGAATSHATVMNCQRLMLRSKANVKDDSNIRVCCPLPFFHGFAGHTVYCGCVIPMTVLIPHYKFMAKEAVETMIEDKCSELNVVPTMAIDLIHYCQENKIKVESIQKMLLAAAHTPPAVIEALHAVFPNLERVVVGYGATETSPVATFPSHDTPQSVMNTTVGTVLDFGSIKIVNTNTGAMVKHNETGEVLVKGLLMQGYWDDPEKTAESMVNGWYKTGDLGQLDQDGRLKITGRVKELIIRGGANIYPREVEDLLHQHPNIQSAGVCGVPHDRLGEEVCAWIKLKDQNVKTTVEEVKQFCTDNISKYKVPAHVFFVDSFPMTASMKMQKFLMTEQSIQMIRKQKEAQSSG